MRRRAALATLALLVVVLSGCAVATDSSWSAPGWDDETLAVAATPEPLDAAGIPALTAQRLRNDTVGVQARFALLPGAAPLNDRVLALVRGAIDARAAASGAAYAPQVFGRGSGLGDRTCARGSTLRPAADLLADPALGPVDATGSALVCDVIAASGSILGQRIRVVSGTQGAVESDVQSVLYTDVATGEVVTAPELWTADAPARLWSDIVETLRRRAGALSLAPVAAPDDAALAAFAPALASTVPGADGTLVFTVPAGFTAPELAALGVPPSDAPLPFAVPPALAAALATPFGAALVAAAAAPYQPPAVVPAGHEPIDCRLFPCVALTYDDGPSELTPGILDELAARHAAASFFVLGSRVSGYADTVRRELAEGHDVGNHSWNHPHLPQLPLDAARRQIRDTSGTIESVTGERVAMFRPPYGEYTAKILEGAGIPAILWDVDTLDWQDPGDDALVTRAVEQPRPGSIVLQHDIHATTARTAGAVYDGLRDRGFSLVTVTQLFGGAVPAAGAWRSGR